VREKSSREIQGEKKVRLVRLFTDPEPRELSVGNGSLSLFLSLGDACDSRHVGGLIPRMRRARAQPVDRSTLTVMPYGFLAVYYIGRTEYISNTCISNTVFEIQIVFQILYFKYNTKCILYFVFQIVFVFCISNFVFEMPKKILDNNP